MAFESSRLAPHSHTETIERRGSEGGRGTLWFMMLSTVLQPS